MDFILHSIFESWKELCLWIIGFTVVFSVLARFQACNPEQPLRREGIVTDLLYCFIMPVFTRFVRAAYISIGIMILFYNESKEKIQEYVINGFGPLSTMPLWLQAAVIFILSDLLLYWLHRWFHEEKMWRFHAIHHSPTQIDWLSTYRFHPINIWLSFTLVDALMILIGFSPAAILMMAWVNTCYSAMVHANLNWTFGPFKYLFASPVFHRWHHTTQSEGMNKNFAPTFPLFDILFGTFYMPKDRLPEQFGVIGSNIPQGFIEQLAWPFEKTKIAASSSATD